MSKQPYRIVRWILTLIVVAVAMAVTLWPRPRPGTFGSAVSTTISSSTRAAAALADCTKNAGVPESHRTATAVNSTSSTIVGPLRGIALPCLADGRTVPLAAMLSGEPTVIVLWAYWCQPCARELPIMRDFARRAGAAVTVFTVHSDPDEAAALSRLHDLDIHLPGVEDAASAVRTALAAPDALPESILLRPDGSLAATVVRPFADADDVAVTVAKHLGVTV